jgi:hypothetical protein
MNRRQPVAALMLLLVIGCGGDRARAAGESHPGAASRDGRAAPSAEPGAAAPAPPSATITDPVELSATARVADGSAAFAGMGECHATHDASIYDVPATMWSARVDAPSGELPYVNLTLWQPKGTSELQVSLGLTLRGQTHRIATVKGAEQHGSARARVEPTGAGGMLRVEGVDAEGQPLTLSVRCSRFTEPVPEGG